MNTNPTQGAPDRGALRGVRTIAAVASVIAALLVPGQYWAAVALGVTLVVVFLCLRWAYDRRHDDQG